MPNAHKNQTPEESIYEACLLRFRPIMMTTMAALLGEFLWLSARKWAWSCGDRLVSPSSAAFW